MVRVINFRDMDIIPFNIQDAEKYGITCAIVKKYLEDWDNHMLIEHNLDAGTCIEEICKDMPCIETYEITHALEELISLGLVYIYFTKIDEVSGLVTQVLKIKRKD